MTELMRRRRAMMDGKSDAVVFPYVVEVPMVLQTICINGAITEKTDWRSSGYIPIPPGATQIKLENKETASYGGRVGLTTSDTQTTGITMLGGAANKVFNGTVKALPSGYNYVYASRSGRDEIDIIATFDKA